MKTGAPSLLAGLSAGLLTLASLFAWATPAAQAADDYDITRFEVTASVDQAGKFTVTETIDMQFNGSGHGMYFWLTTRQGYDDSHDRLLTYDDIRVSSPTGAPTETRFDHGDTYMEIRIGDEDQTVTGTQTYQVDYTLSGIVNPDVATSGMDEVYWNIIGTNWEVPISNLTVQLTGPADLSQTTCYSGADYTAPCTSSASTGPTATYTQDHLQPGQGLAVVGGWPVGTFPDATVDLVPTSQNPFAVNGDSGTVPASAAGLLTLAAAWLLTRLNKKGRDEQFADTTPGSLPADGDRPTIKREEVKQAAVEYAPPDGVPPRLVGAVIRDGSANQDITATIIDLAVRGYIQMEQGQGDDFSLHQTGADPASLNPVDRQVYDGLFADGPVITKESMADQAFYTTYTGFQSTLKEEFDAQGWYKSDPRATVAAYLVGGLLIALLGGVGAFVLGRTLARSGTLGLGWLAVPFVVLGLGMMVLAKRMPVRTPIGSAVAIQSLGFKKYLETAEADQIRWEEGQDIFSQYLPYAIAFGCAERWSKIFEELAARGAPLPQPGWYAGYWGYNLPIWLAINHSIGSIGQSYTDSVQANAAAQAAATGGSAGGSGFSGGGFGGGVGGGGGGGW